MNQRERKIALFLLIVALFWAKTHFFKPAKKDAVRPAVTKNKVTPKPEKVVKPAGEEFTLDDALKRFASKQLDQAPDFSGDPFQKFSFKKKASATALESFDLVLSGIIWEAKEPMALINGEILKVGEAIEGFRVETIRPGEVVVIRGMEKHLLILSAPPEEK